MNESSESIEPIYTLDNDSMDSLRLEYSALKPSEQKKLTDLALDIRNAVIDDYGKYISQDVKVRFSTIENRVLVFDNAGFKAFQEDWTPELKTLADNTENDARIFFNGNLIALTTMKEEASKLWEVNKEFFITRNVQEEIATNYLQYLLITSALVHEFTHACWKETFPVDPKTNVATLALNECGASYITNAILEKKLPATTAIGRVFNSEREEVFKKILQKYGDNAYFVFFNHNPADINAEDFSKLRDDILSEFDTNTLINTGILTTELATELNNLSNISNNPIK